MSKSKKREAERRKYKGSELAPSARKVIHLANLADVYVSPNEQRENEDTMKDSNMTEEWVAAQWKRNPCVKMANGDIRTGPVRGSFVHLLKASKPTPQKPDGGYGMVLLFPLGVDISVLEKEARSTAMAKWPDAGKPGGPKLFYPIRDQDLDGKNQPGEADRYAGYEKGAKRIGANTNDKVTPCDLQLAPIIDEKDIYAGAWYIVTLRCGTFETQGNKGVTFYLQAVMKVADDVNISGTAPARPSEAFAGVAIDAGDINPDAAFGTGAKQEAGADIDPFAS